MYDAVITEKQIVNGINVDELNQTIEAIRAEPAIAEFKFRAVNQWQGGTHNRTTINDLYGAMQEHAREKAFVLDKDEPLLLLGTDLAPNPVEYALAALAGCLTTTLVCFAAAAGIELDAVESKLEGDTDLRGFLGLDESLRRGFSRIRVSLKIESSAAPERISELVELAKARSGVFDMLNNGVPIDVELAA